jgi:hypothetical protein
MPAVWDKTIIVLIPKSRSPERMKDLRPISLCNVIYKIVAKVIASRLKRVLPECISQSQSAFVPGRLITDNILIAYETTHYIHTRKGGMDGIAAGKLDMSKAYDRVDWSFLEKMMLTMGFGSEWVKLVVSCVRTVSYRVKVNNGLTSVIQPQRGLRQGCPLAAYEGASGQMINKEKYAVMFSKGTKRLAKRRFLSTLQISDEAYNERYMGMPIHLGRSKRKAFEYLKETVWKAVE